jgi:hypothetical protein
MNESIDQSIRVSYSQIKIWRLPNMWAFCVCGKKTSATTSHVAPEFPWETITKSVNMYNLSQGPNTLLDVGMLSTASHIVISTMYPTYFHHATSPQVFHSHFKSVLLGPISTPHNIWWQHSPGVIIIEQLFSRENRL